METLTFINSALNTFSIIAIAGRPCTFYNCSGKFGVLERKVSIVVNLPAQYGKNAPKPGIGAVLKKPQRKHRHQIRLMLLKLLKKRCSFFALLFASGDVKR
ncbi:hypothetical protein [Nitrosococcus wardiae]|uniref:Uncharacterized protein n=1 Tax=Nitrosococcus wardiae TaxID=1814290 RepID=A0A4V1AWD8_9GAMM|nr:hypothetical protein [Nitrosococcus wardiae]QBQ56285.1 hypothetical protein E3U44_18610 [Nitrosococcus wardiae]